MTTILKCGRCGKTETQHYRIVVVSEDSFPHLLPRRWHNEEELEAGFTQGDVTHHCGFIAIRHAECGGEKAAKRAVYAHLRRVARRYESEDKNVD